ncbi:MAG: hypothetical protein LBH77_01125 [Tannerella sp.]|nr:hypothetical protein [Tannerella sp.]
MTKLIMSYITVYEESVFLSFKEEYDHFYRDEKLFRDSIIVASLIMSAISLLGLFGFVEDEIMRRKLRYVK